ncbi:hypothetical protein [Mycobacterium arosiense]|nr:hypothetical protein [Mycobacterium arosiense]
MALSAWPIRNHNCERLHAAEVRERVGAYQDRYSVPTEQLR